MVQVLAQPLQDLIMVPDGRGLILTRSKVALQLQVAGRKSNNPKSEKDRGEGRGRAGSEKAAEESGQKTSS